MYESDGIGAVNLDMKEAAMDIQAAQSVSGLSGREAVRGMLGRLQPKEEVLLLGWGVPMPLPAHRGLTQV